MLALSIGLLVVLAVLSVLVIQVWVTHENTLDLLNEKAKFILKSVEKDIASHLDPVREQIEFIAAQIESGAYDIADKARLQILLTGALAPLPQVDRIVVLDPSLQLFAVRRDSPNGISVIELDRSKEPTSLTARDRLQSVTGAVWGDHWIYGHGNFNHRAVTSDGGDGRAVECLARRRVRQFPGHRVYSLRPEQRPRAPESDERQLPVIGGPSGGQDRLRR